MLPRTVLKYARRRIISSLQDKWSKGGVVVRTLASHQCGPGSTPGVDAICGLSLLLVLSLAPRGFSPGTPVFPSPRKLTLPNSNLIWNARTRLNEFIWTRKCFVGKKAIYIYKLSGNCKKDFEPKIYLLRTEKMAVSSTLQRCLGFVFVVAAQNFKKGFLENAFMKIA